MLISVAGSWPIKVTCQETGAKAGDICWYFQLSKNKQIALELNVKGP